MSEAQRKYELYGDAFKRYPYPTFAAMRRDDPTHRQPGLDGKTPIWFVTRYADVEAMLRDPRFVRDPRLALPPDRLPPATPLDALLGEHMLNRDGADHRRLRELVSQGFTPKRVADLRPRVEAIATMLLDPLVGRGEADLIDAFAFPLPSTMVLLIVAGHETTVDLVANGVLALSERPERRDALAADPSGLPRAIEEFLRYDGSVERALNRWAAEDVEWGGQPIRRGEPLILILSSANRDEARFGRPDELDPERAPNAHLAFGKGPHYCLGAPLARLEAEVALRAPLTRLPRLRPSVPREALRYRFLPGFRAPQALPVRWGPQR